jgi:hypothetical protein
MLQLFVKRTPLFIEIHDEDSVSPLADLLFLNSLCRTITVFSSSLETLSKLNQKMSPFWIKLAYIAGVPEESRLFRWRMARKLDRHEIEGIFFDNGVCQKSLDYFKEKRFTVGIRGVNDSLLSRSYEEAGVDVILTETARSVMKDHKRPCKVLSFEKE